MAPASVAHAAGADDREFVIQTLVDRYASAHDDPWAIEDFAVRRLGDDLFLAYELDRDGRRSRRATIWRRTAAGWIAEYHQGTLL